MPGATRLLCVGHHAPSHNDAALAKSMPSLFTLAAARSKSCAPSVHAEKPVPVPTTKCSMQVRNSSEHWVSASTAVSTLGKLDQMLKRYITDFTHAYSIGIAMFYSTSEIHGGQKVFGKLLSHCLVQFWSFSVQVVVQAPWSLFMLIEIEGNAVHLRPISWRFFCGYAAPVYLEPSVSVNIMLADTTHLSFGLWSPFYLGWFAVQSSGSVVQFVVWPILMHETLAANMEHFLVSVQHKGKLLNSDAVLLKLISGLPVVLNTRELCDQVLALSDYKSQLYEYLRSKMNTIVPNLTSLLGELVGACLLVHGRSWLNLVKGIDILLLDHSIFLRTVSGGSVQMIMQIEFLVCAMSYVVAMMTVTTSAITKAYEQNDFVMEAPSTFGEILHTGICQTCPSVISILTVCAAQAVIDFGREVHGAVLRCSLDMEIFVVSAIWVAEPYSLPWPPPQLQVQFEYDNADIRPSPWPSFTLSICCSMSWVIDWKPPWPYQLYLYDTSGSSGNYNQQWQLIFLQLMITHTNGWLAKENFLQHGGCFSACRDQRKMFVLFGILGGHQKPLVEGDNCLLIPVNENSYQPGSSCADPILSVLVCDALSYAYLVDQSILPRLSNTY